MGKKTPYARLETETQNDGWGGTEIWYWLVCDTCEFRESLGCGWAPRHNSVDAHNQQFHHDETRPKLVVHTPRVQAILVCPQCKYFNNELYPLSEGWDYGRFLYTCSAGHLQDVHDALSPTKVEEAIGQLEQRIDIDRENYRLDREAERLEARRKKLNEK